MADVKITALVEKLSVEDDDLLAIVDDPGGTPITKKVTVANAKAGILGGHTVLSTTHSDTLAGTVVRGDIIIGNSTPAWARLAKGAANSVLVSNGTDISWSAAPRLANIADTGGTNKINLNTAPPHVTITSDLYALGTLTTDGNAIFNSQAAIGTTITTGAVLALAFGGTAEAANMRGIYGNVGFSITASRTSFSCLDFLAFIASSTGFTLTNFTGAKAWIGTASTFAGTLSNAAMFWGSHSWNVSAAATVTNTFGLRLDAITGNSGCTHTNVYVVKAEAVTKGTNRYGLHLGSLAGGTIAYLLELGAGPTLRLKDRGTGGWTAAANETPLWIEQGATPTLRQMKTRVWDATAGHGFTNGDLVCYLV